MAKRNKSSSDAPPSPASSGTLWIAIRALLAVALGVGIYLGVSALKEGSVAGCGPDSGCHNVLQSRWAYLGSIPVSVLSIPVYLALLVAAVRIRPNGDWNAQRTLWLSVFGLGTMVLAAAVWFVAIQFFVIRQLCPYCLVAHACAGLAVVLLMRQEAQHRRSLKGNQRKQWIASDTRSQLIGLGVFSVMLLAGGQALIQPPSVENQTLQATEPQVNTETVPTDPSAPIVYYNGRFSFDPKAVPLVGSPNAPHKMISLFDYTCNHCRVMHGMLKSVQNTFSNELAILSLPMPIDVNCNPLLQRMGRDTPDDHIGACEYARLALAVWRAEQAKFAIMDDWLFTGERAPALEEARAFAEGLIGRDALQQGLNDPWVQQQIATDVAFYETNAMSLRNSKMPQLITGKNISFGQFNQVGEIYKILEEQFQLKRAEE